MKNKVLIEDMEYIANSLDNKEKQEFKNANILLTGCAGFLGFYFMQFFAHYAESLGIKSITAIDNFHLGKPNWLENMENSYKNIHLHFFDITKDDISSIQNSDNIDFIIHMASIASPPFYRRYPLKTIDANVIGLRKLLDFYKDKKIKSFLFFSSSEIYGDPFPEFIPTSEDYRGNVATIGPRACYDEAKRFGETLCYIFSTQYNVPIKIIRPFNNYGPGMALGDERLPADFAKAVFENKDIVLFSDGTPTRTFCYISDAIVGYLKGLVYNKFDYFNIGIDNPEISIIDLAHIYFEKGKEIYNYSGNVKYDKSPDIDYLTHSPSRRCPNIDKAKNLLNYNPTIKVNEGVARYLEFVKLNEGKL